MQDFKRLYEAIYKANPELLELTFGCRFIVGNEVHVLISTGKNGGYTSGILNGDKKGVWGLQSYGQDFLSEHADDIIGHPILLANVLFTLSKKYGPDFFDHVVTVVDIYDLTKDLAGQSDETKQFLEKIICG